jgi:hypothetical protein
MRVEDVFLILKLDCLENSKIIIKIYFLKVQFEILKNIGILNTVFIIIISKLKLNKNTPCLFAILFRTNCYMSSWLSDLEYYIIS